MIIRRGGGVEGRRESILDACQRRRGLAHGPADEPKPGVPKPQSLVERLSQ
jgi:hypothetical protein